MNKELRIDRIFDLNEFVSTIGGRAEKFFTRSCQGICLDSRVIKPGDVFFAIKSERDGHEYVRDAVKRGAMACVVSRDVSCEEQILVPDTLQCLWNFAASVRGDWRGRIIALSGSNGKTTTKEMLALLLGETTLKTPGTWNNFLGVPLTLLMLEKSHKYAVIEMGINHFGELLQLCRFTKPNIAVLTNVGPAHLQELHDLDGVAKAKGEIFSQLQTADIAVLNMDDSRIGKMKPNIRGKIITFSKNINADIQLVSKDRKNKGYQLTLRYGLETINVDLPVSGEHMVSNYLCAVAVCYAMEIPARQIENQTPKITSIHMRMEEIVLSENRKIINDCYNANLGSFEAALQTISETKPKKFLVLMGDILEMGSHASHVHQDAGRMMAKFGVEHLFVTGEFADDVILGAIEAGLSKDQVTKIEKKTDAVEKILPYFQAGDILLIKGSRGMKLEEIVSALEHRLKGDSEK